MQPYDHTKIEKKWQKEWNKKKLYKTGTKGKKMYVLDMFPYPSGSGLHVGHPRGYIGSDVYARMKRMEGFNVLHPMGYDAFGLPAEQYAIEHKIHPRKAVETNIKTFRNQLDRIGFSYDWSRQVNTTDPNFYKWTQWIFLKLYNSYYDLKKNKAWPINDLEKLFAKEGNQNVQAAVINDVLPFGKKEWISMSKKEKQEVLMNYRLAYEGYSEVNWCPKLGTVLANDEVIDSKNGTVSERGNYPVEKKLMRQWFLRITAYAEKLLEGLNGIDWPEHIKEIQKNWIGKSEGSEIEFTVKSEKGSELAHVAVFTTRADTLFGVTYLVLAPEHQLIKELKENITNREAVELYVNTVTKKTPEERTDAKKEKSGVQLEGIFAINPANREKIPVFIAEYVLNDYGTGAVMAVPAHDERDFQFAKKYELPAKEVIRPYVIDKVNVPHADKPTKTRVNVHVIVYDPKAKKYLIIRNKKFGWDTVVIGGVEENEEYRVAAVREIREETGYTDLVFKRALGFPVQAAYFAKHKDENRKAISSALYFELASQAKVKIPTDGENEGNEILWIDALDFIPGKMINSELPFWLERLHSENDIAYMGDGILVNSGSFNDLSSSEAKKEITKFVKGKFVTNYKLRDAVFARQRYWGEPIPLIHQKDGTIAEVPEKKLPLKLPEVKSYEPSGTGESPLANVKEWMKKGYETNTMPGWAGSSWYFLRYTDPNNTKMFASKKSIKYWFGNRGVDMYVGGAEHATGHLLYSRFWHKFLFDLGLVSSEEPFHVLKNQGIILASDGSKMSKRNPKGIVNPNDVIKLYGADTLRVYEMFMGPFEASLPWSTESIIGSRRFIEKVWRLGMKVFENDFSMNPISAQKILHRTIQKVTNDIKSFSFNTAISAMMICINDLEKMESVSIKDFKLFLQLLAPFAPHVADELWSLASEKKSIHRSVWPKVDQKLLIDAEMKIVLQVNGKTRDVFTVPSDLTQKAIELQALARAQKYVGGKEIKRIVYVPGKLVNIVL